ncbi:MAG TPA: hypothetical protein ENL20_00605 [Candidatus Cloacimonetes bacterium]|nr:hypothetical protein [Candidatus Cloacimonadota bacterium]
MFETILLIGGGYVVCKMIFSRYPLKKATLDKIENRTSVYLLWLIAIGIIIAQLYFIIDVFLNLFKATGEFKGLFFFIGFVILAFYGFLYVKRKM